jgi:hypothetical protein
VLKSLARLIRPARNERAVLELGHRDRGKEQLGPLELLHPSVELQGVGVGSTWR